MKFQLKKITKGDAYFKSMIKDILLHGTMDINPRPKYADGTPAHTKSINHAMFSYSLVEDEVPFITVRPIAVKSGIKEILWIYQDQSNDLNLLKNKYGVTWWDAWDIGDRTIGACYGETVRRHNLINNLLEGLEKDPDGRRHIMCLWQEDDFKDPHGLKPCAYNTIWNIRNLEDGTKYLDMCLLIRSNDFLVACAINQLQYVALQYMIAGHLGINVGKFTFFMDNVQIYDRHFEIASELYYRFPILFKDGEFPKFVVPKKNFFDYTIDDFVIENYPLEEIKKVNPQVKFDLGI